MWIIGALLCAWVFVWVARRIVARMSDTDALRAQVAELLEQLRLEREWRQRLQAYFASSQRVPAAVVPTERVSVPGIVCEPLSADSGQPIDLDAELGTDPLDAPRVVTRRKKPKRKPV